MPCAHGVGRPGTRETATARRSGWRARRRRRPGPRYRRRQPWRAGGRAVSSSSNSRNMSPAVFGQHDHQRRAGCCVTADRHRRGSSHPRSARDGGFGRSAGKNASSCRAGKNSSASSTLTRSGPACGSCGGGAQTSWPNCRLRTPPSAPGSAKSSGSAVAHEQPHEDPHARTMRSLPGIGR